MHQANHRLSRKIVFQSPSHFLAFGMGTGLARYAPGTVGTLAAIPFYFLLHLLVPVLYLGAVAVAFGVGVVVCGRATKSLNTPDHPGIVWDEMVGLWITMCCIPFSWGALLIGFLLFRLLDIAKPWPLNLIDRRVGGGLGIMLDDALAGIFANLGLWSALAYFPSFFEWSQP